MNTQISLWNAHHSRLGFTGSHPEIMAFIQSENCLHTAYCYKLLHSWHRSVYFTMHESCLQTIYPGDIRKKFRQSDFVKRKQGFKFFSLMQRNSIYNKKKLSRIGLHTFKWSANQGIIQFFNCNTCHKLKAIIHATAEEEYCKLDSDFIHDALH